MPSIAIRTPIPGPNSKSWTARRADAVPRGVSAATPIFVEYAEGATIVDVDGNRLLDLAGGIGCINVGHRNASVLDAMHKQMDSHLHLCFQVTGYGTYVELAEQLNEIAPGCFPKKTLLLNSGAEAVENAVKIARAYTKKPAVICFSEAFHGRTLLGLALTSKTNPYKLGFGPFMPEIYRLPYGSSQAANKTTLAQEQWVAMFEETFSSVVPAEEVAAIILEPIQGEGGFNVAQQSFLDAVAFVCRKYGIVFIMDEVQTGFGRTGEMFASTLFGIEPDLLVTAKSLGGGMPIAAVTGRSEIMDAPVPGGLGGTFGGNPVACAAALAVIREFADGRLARRASELGVIFLDRALQWKRIYPFIGELRGLGAMRAIEFIEPSSGGRPNAEAAKAVVQHCLAHGVIILLAGVYGNVVRLLVPLVISDSEFEEAMAVLEDGVRFAALALEAP